MMATVAKDDVKMTQAMPIVSKMPIPLNLPLGVYDVIALQLALHDWTVALDKLFVPMFKHNQGPHFLETGEFSGFMTPDNVFHCFGIEEFPAGGIGSKQGVPDEVSQFEAQPGACGRGEAF